jgi:hypothetical protein
MIGAEVIAQTRSCGNEYTAESGDRAVAAQPFPECLPQLERRRGSFFENSWSPWRLNRCPLEYVVPTIMQPREFRFTEPPLSFRENTRSGLAKFEEFRQSNSLPRRNDNGLERGIRKSIARSSEGLRGRHDSRFNSSAYLTLASSPSTNACHSLSSAGRLNSCPAR